MLEKALEKLESQFKAEKDPVRKQFAKPVLEHMKKRCREDAGLCQDVLQEHKTWGRCYAHITKTARQHIKGNAGAVIDSTVFEWAEDYFRQDDKAQIERQAKQEKEQKAKEAKRKAQKASKKPAKPKTKPNTPKETKADRSDSGSSQPSQAKDKKTKPKSKQKEVEGQMSIFDFLGGES